VDGITITTLNHLKIARVELAIARVVLAILGIPHAIPKGEVTEQRNSPYD
jgi:hypothetical protein